jgi:hypothetical protein
VSDSWTIVEYLKDTYQPRPFLFVARKRGPNAFHQVLGRHVVNGALVRLLLTDIYAHLHEKDRRYFRESREKRFACCRKKRRPIATLESLGSVKV